MNQKTDKNSQKRLTNNTFYLEGLNCANCAAKIEDSLKQNQSFTFVNFSFATKKLVLESASTNTDTLRILTDTVNSIEDGVEIIDEKTYEEETQSSTSNNSVSARDIIKNNWRTLIGLGILVPTMILDDGFELSTIGYLAAYILIGGDIAFSAFRNILRGKIFDENFLMTLATLGAFFLGEYVEAVAVMLFYKVGEGFQDYAVDHTRRSIKSLINLKAEFANLMKDHEVKQIDPKELQVGDIILIKPGEKIPVDSSVLEGSSTIDNSALTGESLPVHVTIGSKLLSGAINLNASLTARVDQTFNHSTVAKILNMVENASGKKAKTEQFISKFAKVYTPIVVLSALLLSLLPPILGYGDFREWISRALIFLVISCPCALVLSVPLGYFGGLGAASRSGILIKGGNYLEALNTIDTFAFDKTGTLTKGNFKVAKFSDNKTLELAALIEIHSNHPIATSIVKAYDADVSIKSVSQVKEIPGKGLEGIYESKLLLAGNERLMESYGINFTSDKHIGSIVHVAYNKKYIGAIYIEDEIKEGSRTLADNFKSLKKSIMMLTGDQGPIANQVAGELDIDLVHSQLLPGDKLSTLETLIDQGNRVLFVGDGINDAPVLARADIGVAMGGLGSDAAIEAADMVIMNDDPSKLLTAMDIARKTRTIVLENIAFALGVKLFFLCLGALGYANMYEAIFADVGVALIAVLNSMRTLRLGN